MLNSTLTATERTLCCILENCQKEGGVEVPKVLRAYMGGIEFLPFKQPLDVKQAADSKSNKSKSKVFICLCWPLSKKKTVFETLFYLIFLGHLLTGKCCLRWMRNKSNACDAEVMDIVHPCINFWGVTVLIAWPWRCNFFCTHFGFLVYHTIWLRTCTLILHRVSCNLECLSTIIPLCCCCASRGTVIGVCCLAFVVLQFRFAGG